VAAAARGVTAAGRAPKPSQRDRWREKRHIEEKSMSSPQNEPQVLVGPRCLDDRICRLVYLRATDEVWTEEWQKGSWVRTSALVRHVLKAPFPKKAQLRRRGIPLERGAWDGDVAFA
jgi:hypothetical protein